MTTEIRNLLLLILALTAVIVTGYALLYATGVIGPSLFYPLGRP